MEPASPSIQPQVALELGTSAGSETQVLRWEGSKLPRLTSPTSRGWRRAGGPLGGADVGAGAWGSAGQRLRGRRGAPEGAWGPARGGAEGQPPGARGTQGAPGPGGRARTAALAAARPARAGAALPPCCGASWCRTAAPGRRGHSAHRCPRRRSVQAGSPRTRVEASGGGGGLGRGGAGGEEKQGEDWEEARADSGGAALLTVLCGVAALQPTTGTQAHRAQVEQAHHIFNASTRILILAHTLRFSLQSTQLSSDCLSDLTMHSLTEDSLSHPLTCCPTDSPIEPTHPSHPLLRSVLYCVCLFHVCSHYWFHPSIPQALMTQGRTFGTHEKTVPLDPYTLLQGIAKLKSEI